MVVLVSQLREIVATMVLAVAETPTVSKGQ
jgi:hypothetical protein